MHDVAMVSAAGLGLTLEPRQSLGIVREGLGKNFDRDLAVEFRIARAIDLAHTARAERCDDFIRPESSSDRHAHASS